MIPRIETERLRLRGHRQEDFPSCVGMWGDPEVTRFIGGRPFSEEETWARFLRYAGLWPVLGFGYWVIEDRATGSFVGEVGCADLRREIQPSLQGLPELGWALVSAAHGKGLATEAVRAVLAWCDGTLQAAKTVCIIQPENVASVRVAVRCGFQERHRTVYKDRDTVIFDRERPSAL